MRSDVDLQLEEHELMEFVPPRVDPACVPPQFQVHPGMGGNLEESLEDGCGNKRVIVGICAMAKKSQSKPMTEILTRLEEFEYLRTVIFEEQVILEVSTLLFYCSHT
ncbi:PPIP5K2 [Cordylochernes scorpioides]|uniref:PPIP5K2 n=1 Tax=Cordylochernes scorpioides TaxID=51811 RepID=A0ABY6LS93_9ARAC|nr:PPIP5K2 [Cordylochernes scorpioides]